MIHFPKLSNVISAYKLEIEAGRYLSSAKNSNSEATKRLCKNCNLSNNNNNNNNNSEVLLGANIHRPDAPLASQEREVEDEINALMSCPKYEVDRKAMLNNLEDAFPHLQASSVKDKFIFIMKCNDSEVTLDLSKMLTAIKRIRGVPINIK